MNLKHMLNPLPINLKDEALRLAPAFFVFILAILMVSLSACMG
ncbi:hypothetical protein N1030_12480 [Desulfovibrio mangrovi]|nr:hypothetical protein [Desulfovibrio mangrovi]UZP66423.1 hypothetical protein N1030_12480 [Desulfovibrio mangrovi]